MKHKNEDLRVWKSLVQKLNESAAVTETHDNVDHEVSMAKSQLLSAVKSATRIGKNLANISEEKGIDGWIASKITMAQDYLQAVADYLDGEAAQGIIPSDEDQAMKTENGMAEETYEGDEFYEAYGDLWFNEDEQLDEAEYQGRKVKLGKPMQGDVKKFKVYVKDPSTGNTKKVNFGDPDMKIKKSNPARRKSFRARHNCDNPGPRTKARYWSCRKW